MWSAPGQLLVNKLRGAPWSCEQTKAYVYVPGKRPKRRGECSSLCTKHGLLLKYFKIVLLLFFKHTWLVVTFEVWTLKPADKRLLHHGWKTHNSPTHLCLTGSVSLMCNSTQEKHNSTIIWDQLGFLCLIISLAHTLFRLFQQKQKCILWHYWIQCVLLFFLFQCGILKKIISLFGSKPKAGLCRWAALVFVFQVTFTLSEFPVVVFSGRCDASMLRCFSSVFY